MSTNHTLSPWFVSRDPINSANLVITAAGDVLAYIRLHDGYTVEEAKANAAVMAAAPELLEAADAVDFLFNQYLLSNPDKNSSAYKIASDLAKQARAAATKARMV